MSSRPNLPPHFTTFRTCYRHPAGTVGVALTRWLTAEGWLAPLPPPPGTPPGRGGACPEPRRRVPVLGAYRLTDAGAAGLARLGVQPAGVSAGGDYKACADYTTRLPNGQRGVPHVGGPLGAALGDWLMAAGHAARRADAASVYDRRTLVLTDRGQRILRELGVLEGAALPAAV